MSKFSPNDSPMAPEWVSEKNSNFQNMNILYIALKHLDFEYVITFANYLNFVIL